MSQPETHRNRFDRQQDERCTNVSTEPPERADNTALFSLALYFRVLHHTPLDRSLEGRYRRFWKGFIHEKKAFNAFF